MKKITLTAAGISFEHAFTTVVTQVKEVGGKFSIKLDSLKGVMISLEDHNASELGIEKDRKVTITPVAGSDDGSFTLEVGKKEVKKTPAAPTRGSSPMSGRMMSNCLP